jgi:hypothetical protein
MALGCNCEQSPRCRRFDSGSSDFFFVQQGDLVAHIMQREWRVGKDNAESYFVHNNNGKHFADLKSANGCFPDSDSFYFLVRWIHITSVELV